MADRIKTGATVRFMDPEGAHDVLPQCYPPKGTLGRVLYASNSSPLVLVDWTHNSTQMPGPWTVAACWLEPVGWREKLKLRRGAKANATK